MERKTAVFSLYIRLFNQADKYDVFMMLLGSIGSFINGFSLPVMYIIQSHVYNGYAKQVNGGLIHKNSNKQVLFCLYLAVVTFIGAYLEVSCWIYTGHRQAGRLRIKYASSLLRQDTTYFDTQCSSAEVINNVSTDIVHVQEAVGEKLGQLIENVFLFVGSFIVSMILTWRLTIIFIPFTLVLLMPGFMYSRALSSYANQRQTSYTEAGKIAEQAISSVRLVYSFVAERRTWESFSNALEKSTKADKMQGLAKGLTLGLHGLRYFVWALMIWYGGGLVLKGEANGAQIFIAGSSFVVGSMALGSVVQNMREVKDGQAALQRIFHVLDKTPSIDIENSKGKFLHKLHGQLEFNNVVFAYPSRPGINVLNGFNLRISPGKTTAVIGGSGSGKSTVVALLERLYDPINGEVLLDGFNIKHLQLRWYRQQIGLVSQEPVLFSSSIRENILLGKEEATVDEVINAAKLANAHEFIINFPAGYETQVGVKGAQLSGGQKQRIALARAIIRNPAILLLDEATSALDNESERAVKKGMQEVVNNRTTVIIAHKLSAICDADFVAYVELGQVAQFGRLDEFPEMFNELKQLKQLKHVYKLQNTASERDDEIMEARIDGKLDNTRHGSSSKFVFNRLLMMNKPEWKYCIFGMFGAVCIGFVHPLFVTVGADAITTFYSPNFDKVRRKIRVDAGIFAVLSVISIIINTVQHYSFGAMGAALTKRVREKMLKNILQCDVSWFDEEKHSCGALTSRLSTSASMVRGIVGDRISILVQTASTLLISLIASFVISWRLAIVLISIQPLILVCFYFRVNNLQDFARKAAGIQEEVSQLVLEGVTQHQTVAAFNSQIRIISVLESRLKTISARAVGLCQVAGMSSGIALFALFSSYGLCLWYGGKLISENKITFKEFLITFYLLIGTGRSLADILSLTPDIIQGTTVAESIFEILDEQTSVKPTEFDTACDVKLQGRIEFANVTFAYPSRPSYNVLKEFNLTVEACKTVALVGRSGSGKSTAIGLLERFYDPQVGHILVDNVDINDIPVGFLRKHIGLVSQEPTLFACSIRENIAYGKDNATDAEVIQAAQAANAHEFISALPQGYCTFVGEIGVQLSGGQKQRIAIARAILKQPKILLLDEATSALDRKSETAVQAALERAMDGITSIIVAHRISTIVNAHKIAVIREGIVVEQGTYKDLLAKEHHGEFISLLNG